MRPVWRRAFIAAVVLTVAGLCLRVIALAGTDAPRPEEWRSEVEGLYRPWLAHGGFPSSGFVREVLRQPDPAARVWKLALLRANGQWDPRLLAFSALLPLLLAAGLFFAVALPGLSRPGVLFLSTAAVLFFLFPAVSHGTLAASSAWAGLLLLLSLLHLAGASRPKPATAGWWAGHAAALANVLASSAGLASPLAVCLCAAAWPGKDPEAARTRKWLLLADGSLAAAGLARFAWAAGPVRLFDRAGPSLHQLTAWPLHGRFSFLLVLAPAAALAFGWRVRSRREKTLPFGLLASVWILLLLPVLALPGMLPPGADPAAVLAFGLFIQVQALALLPSGGGRASSMKILAAFLWVIVIGNGLFQKSRLLPDAASIEFPEPPAAAAGVGRILSPPVRPALPLRPSPSAEPAFLPGAAPALGGKPPQLPVWGNWQAAGGGRVGEWTSLPLSTSAPILEFFVAGSLRPPATSLVLRTADRREIAPFQNTAEAPGRWKEINFPAPPGPFQVVARANDPAAWFAFSAPVEAGRLSWLVRKLLPLWLGALAGGVVLLFAGGAALAVSLRQDRQAGDLSVRLLRRLLPAAPWVALFAYLLFLSNFIDTYAGGSDASGYLHSAKLLVHGRLTLPPRAIAGLQCDPQLYAPLAFGMSRGAIAPGYPVGLPLLLAAVGRVLSLERAIPLVIMAHFLLGIVLTQRLGALAGLGRSWSWLSAAMIAGCPLYVFMGLQPMSDVPALVWVTAALVLALSSRDRPFLAAASGAACGIAILIRPANVLCLLPVSIVAAATRDGFSPRRLLLWAAGGLPCAVFEAWYNRRLYGSPFRTGYGDMRSAFNRDWIGPTLGHYLHWIPIYLTPLVWLALAGFFVRAIPGRLRCILGLVAAAYLGFYSSYEFTHDSWWYLRFILPAFPPLAVLAAAAMEGGVARLAARPPSASRLRAAAAAAALAVVVCNAAAEFTRLPILYSGRGNAFYRESSRWLQAHAPAGAVVLAFQASGALSYYTSLPLIRAEAFNARAVAAAVRRLDELGRPVYALACEYDSLPAFRELPGRWILVERIAGATIWRQEAPKS